MKDSALGHLSFYYLHNPVIESLEQKIIEKAVFQYDIVEASHLGLHIVNSRVAEDDSGNWLEIFTNFQSCALIKTVIP